MWWKAWIWVLLSSIAMSQSPLSLGFLVWKAVLKILISYVAGGFAEILDLWTSHRHCRLSTNIHRRFGACFLRRRKWQPTPVSSSGELHAQRSLSGCRPGGHKRAGHDWVTKPHVLTSFFECFPRSFCAVLPSGFFLFSYPQRPSLATVYNFFA